MDDENDENLYSLEHEIKPETDEILENCRHAA